MDDPIRKHDGQVLLFRRNGIYQARIHLGKGKYLPRSLKTANTAEAERLAEELWNDTRYELKKGLPVRKKTVNTVLDGSCPVAWCRSVSPEQRWLPVQPAARGRPTMGSSLSGAMVSRLM